MTRKTAWQGLGTAAVVIRLAAGCMPDQVEVGRAPTEGGAGEGAATGRGVQAMTTGGGGGRAGSGARGHGGSMVVGPGAGHSGSAGAEQAGAPGAGRGGSPSAGRGGSSPGGTSGVGGDSGQGPGGASGIHFDEDCDCTYESDGQFSCTTTLDHMTARVDVPTDCSNDLDYVYQATCSAQVTYTRWSEGTENEYRYEKTTGVASYVGAFGYVGSLCNVTFDHGVGQPGPGTVEGGGRATAFCAAECAVCGTRLDGQPVCGQDDCELGPGGVYGQYSLAELCFRYGCPGTLADAESMRLGCTGTSASFVRQYTGCGVIQLESYAGFSSNRYFFDPTTKELVGAVEGTDTGRPCQGSQVSELRGGDVPAGECTDVTTCDFCTLDSGAGGTTSPSGLDVCPVN